MQFIVYHNCNLYYVKFYKRCILTYIHKYIVHSYSSRCEVLMVNNEGLGFHIKGGAPVTIYATDPGSSAARAGVVPGSCIVEVSVFVCMNVHMNLCIASSVINWPCGPMDKASDYESGDSRFKSWQGQLFVLFLVFFHKYSTFYLTTKIHIQTSLLTSKAITEC